VRNGGEREIERERERERDFFDFFDFFLFDFFLFGLHFQAMPAFQKGPLEISNMKIQNYIKQYNNK